MHNTATRTQWIIASILLTVFAVAVYIGVLSLNAFSVTPDIAGLACAADRYAQTGELGTYQNWNDFEMCWNERTYIALQYSHGWIISLFHIPIDILVQITPAIAFLITLFAIGYVAWSFTNRFDVTVLTVALSIVTPTVLRTILLTPQNIFGYALMSIGMALICWQANAKKPWYLLLLLPLTFLLFFTHDLSFAVATTVFVLWLVLGLPKQWWLRTALLASGLLLLWLQLTVGFLPALLAAKLNIFLNSNLSGVYNALWEHPVIFGYAVSALAALGVYGSYRNGKLAYDKAQIRTLLLLAIIVGAAFGQATLLDVGLLPNRFVPFAWLGVLPFAAIGLVQLRAALHMQDRHSTTASKVLYGTWIALAIVVFAGQAVHGLRYTQDDVVGWAERYQARTDFKHALHALNEIDPHGRLMGIQVAANQEILIAPLWYSGNVLYYPWYNLNHRDIMQFEVVNPDSRLASVFKKPNSTLYKRTRAMFDIITSPESDAAAAAIDTLEVDYLIIPKPSQAYKRIWENVTADQHPLIIENDYYAIYELR